MRRPVVLAVRHTLERAARPLGLGVQFGHKPFTMSCRHGEILWTILREDWPR
jgi:hypothetical protein